MIAFGYYGGKNLAASDILPYLPECDHYVEPFGGSLAILLNRKPSKVETASDLNGDIVNFFRMLRKYRKELVTQLLLTPYSREEFEEAWKPTEDNLERARRFYVRMKMDISKGDKIKDKSWSVNVRYLPGEHDHAPLSFIKKVTGLPEIAARLRRVQLENWPALKIIKKYDRKETLFYCDPPYLPSTRTAKNNYKYEMTEEQHRELSTALNGAKGMVAMSGYDSDLMNNLYPEPKWFKVKFPKKQLPMANTTSKRSESECLWLNYDITKVNGQLKLF